MIQRLIKNFTFDEDIRSGLVFSDVTKIRLNSENALNPKIQLKVDALGNFSTDADIFVETPLTTPQAVQKWLKFEAIVGIDSSTGLLPTEFTLGFKVKTTAGNRYWDGGAWVVAGLSDWSTEAEINANLDTFPIATIGNKSIGFVVNLVTTDKTLTPEVKELKLVGEFELEPLDDLVYNSLIRKLNTEFRSNSVLRFPSTGLISSIDLDTVLENKGYNITGIRAVYNLTDDPLKLSNLFDSYTPGAVRQDGFTNDPGVVTFTSAIPAARLVEVQFKYVPEIYVRMGQDFFEVPAYPSIVFENIVSIDDAFTTRDTNSIQDFVRDKAALTAVVLRGGRQQTLRFEYAVNTDRQLDQMRLHNGLNRFWSNNKSIQSFALDCKYSINIVEQVNTAKNKDADDTDTMVANGSFDVKGVLFFDKPATDEPLVKAGGVNTDFELID